MVHARLGDTVKGTSRVATPEVEAALKRVTVVVAVSLLLGMPAFATGVAAHNVETNDYEERGIELDVEGGIEDVGRILAPIDGEVPAVSLAVLPGGDLLYFSGAEADESKNGPTDLHFMWEATPKDAKSRVLDITDVSEDEDGNIQVVFDVRTPDPEKGGDEDIFCSGITITSTGEAVAPGSTTWHTLDEDPPDNFYTPLKGGEQTVLYDPIDNVWNDGPDMEEARWYPSALQLPSGESLVASGVQTLFFPNTYNTLLETLDPEPEKPEWEVQDASFEVADGVTIPQNVLPDTPSTPFAFVDETHKGLPNLPMYPRLHVLPGGPHEGEVLYAANGDVWAPFGHHPNQPIFGHFQTLDTTDWTWSIHETSPFSLRNLGATVPLMVDAEDPQPRIMSFGGTLHQSGVATDTAEIIDASGERIQSLPTDSMDLPRWTVNGALLPDGSVLAAGGSVYDNVLMFSSPTVGPLNLERFVPSEGGLDGEWETLPAMETVRAYHSSAVLMDDARVLLGGHVPLPAFHDAQREHMNPQHVNTTFEIYEPAYLHHEDAERPGILIDQLEVKNPGHAPSGDMDVDLEALFGDTLTVPVENLDGLDSVVLMKPGASTHQFNADQMGIQLSASDPFDQDGDTVIEVDIPSTDEATLVPGAYMLFVNEDMGDGDIFPSEAAWIDIR